LNYKTQLLLIVFGIQNLKIVNILNMKQIFLFITVISFLFSKKVTAQQLPYLSSAHEMQSFLNPGAPSADFLRHKIAGSVNILHCRQWSGLPNSINTQIVNGSYFNTNKKLLFGANFMHDANGPTGQLSLYANTGYVISADPKESGIGFGLQAGVSQFLIKVDEITFRDHGDVSAEANIMQLYPDVGLGMFGYSSLSNGYEDDRIYGGLSIPQVFGLDLTVRDKEGKEFNMTRVRHYYGNVGLIKHLSQDLRIEPMIAARYVRNGGFNAAASCMMTVGEVFSAGAGYDTANQFSINIEVQFARDNSVGRIGYNYVKSWNQYTSLFGPTHEFKLSFAL
jgi:type IX secretion system PorP/SprF family membrane protein